MPRGCLLGDVMLYTPLREGERINRFIPGISRRPHLPYGVTCNRFYSVHFKVISIECKLWEGEKSQPFSN
ncbi:hypothetical protein E2C01_050977 [Portunus trituberculatus]|uniref:Uncharacterized protein n=1 Tax=Portunus trituberculatus TaxID=210409 RepID=A0A5B7GHJ2_PORTR|nr:hypothetical protein [Portunus trituberculatus]